MNSYIVSGYLYLLYPYHNLYGCVVGGGPWEYYSQHMHAFTPQDKRLTLDHPHHIRKSPNMYRRVIEKRLRFQERKEDQDSAVSIGSSSTGPPSHQQSATDLTLHQSQDLVVVSTDSAVHAVAEYHQTRMSETPPDSPLGESGIGMSFQRPGRMWMSIQTPIS